VPTNPFVGGSPIELDVLAATRAGLHQLAEQVLAADLVRHTGLIGLRPVPGGIGTPPFIVDGATRQVLVVGTELVLVNGEERTSWEVTTVADAGRHLDLTTGAPAVYTAATPVEPDRPLDLDGAAVQAIADWLAVGADALERFAAEHGGADPTKPQLWPEHFDLAISISGANYGVSPGDDELVVPYAYVGPWPPPADAGQPDSFWNQRFGRSVPATELADSADVVDVFQAGWDHLP
jgi:hypothetical protein